jgi:hypothetical protein
VRRFRAPGGADGYSVVSVSELPQPLGVRPTPNGFHWHTSGRNALTFLNYPTIVPREQRFPAALAAGPDCHMTFALRIRQIAPVRIHIEGLLWSSIIVGDFAERAHRGYWAALNDRVRAHLAAAPYDE